MIAIDKYRLRVLVLPDSVLVMSSTCSVARQHLAGITYQHMHVVHMLLLLVQVLDKSSQPIAV